MYGDRFPPLYVKRCPQSTGVRNAGCVCRCHSLTRLQPQTYLRSRSTSCQSRRPRFIRFTSLRNLPQAFTGCSQLLPTMKGNGIGHGAGTTRSRRTSSKDRKEKGTSHMKKLIVGSILALVLVSMARARAAKAPGMYSGPPWASSGGNHDNHTIHRSRFCNVRSVRSVRSFGTVGTSGQAAPQAAPQDATREYL